MGFVSVLIAALVISCGSYLIGLSTIRLDSYSIFDLIATLRMSYFIPGVILNLIGSFFYASGRLKFTSYAYAWNLYLALLVFFGSLIACFYNHERFSLVQVAGIGFTILGMMLISSK